jgi:hypothetical protein
MRNRCLPVCLVVRNICLVLALVASSVVLAADIHASANEQQQRTAGYADCLSTKFCWVLSSSRRLGGGLSRRRSPDQTQGLGVATVSACFSQ